jgi:hypothetical protein
MDAIRNRSSDRLRGKGGAALRRLFWQVAVIASGEVLVGWAALSINLGFFGFMATPVILALLYVPVFVPRASQ